MAGLIGENASDKTNFLQCVASREVPVPAHIDMYLLAEEAKPTDRTAVEALADHVRAEATRLDDLADEIAFDDGYEHEHEHEPVRTPCGAWTPAGPAGPGLRGGGAAGRRAHTHSSCTHARAGPGSCAALHPRTLHRAPRLVCRHYHYYSTVKPQLNGATNKQKRRVLHSVKICWPW